MSGDKLILYSWRCQQCELKFDELGYSDVFTSACPQCGGEGKRLISAPRLDPRLGLDPAFSTMGDKWAKVREQRRRIEDRRAAEHGEDD